MGGGPHRELQGRGPGPSSTSALPSAVLAPGLPVQAHGVAGVPVSLEQAAQLLLHGRPRRPAAGGPLADHQAHPRGAAEVVLRPVGGAWGGWGGGPA